VRALREYRRDAGFTIITTHTHMYMQYIIPYVLLQHLYNTSTTYYAHTTARRLRYHHARCTGGWQVSGRRAAAAWESERDGPTLRSTFSDLSVLRTPLSPRFVLRPSPFQSIVKQQRPARHLSPAACVPWYARAPDSLTHTYTYYIVNDDGDRGRAPSRV